MEGFELLVAGAVGLAGLRMLHDWRKGKAPEVGERVLPPIGRRGPLDEFLHPMVEPIRVGDVKLDFYETHMRLLAMSGGYKTTLLADLVRQRIEAKRPVVVLTGGDSDQLEAEIRSHGGWVIRPSTSPLRFNAFEGEPRFMAQVWASLFPTSSKAMVYHSAFELAALAYFESTNRYSVRGLKEFVLTYEPPPPESEELAKLAVHSKTLWQGMKEGYGALRLELMDKFLGDWIGDELSINRCVEQRIPLMFCLDSKDDPDIIRLSAAIVWGQICYAVFTTGGLDAFVDEFGRLPSGLVNEPVRTFRRNRSHLIAASHTDRDFDPILEDMFHINCLGRMTGSATDTRKASAAMTWGVLHPTAFGAHALGRRRTRFDDLVHAPRSGYFWLVDLERVQQAKVPSYKPLKRPWQRHSHHAYLLRVRPSAVSGRARGTGSGTAASDKQKVAVLGSGTPSGNGGVLGTAEQREREFMKELSGRVHGPPEQPGWTKLKEQTENWWLGLSFPWGALDEQSCWHTTLALKGKGQRPGCQFAAKKGEPWTDWQAYDLFKALAEADDQGFLNDARLLSTWLAYVKLHLKTKSLSGDHLCEEWRGTEGKLCVRPAHVNWEDKLVNSELHWSRLREREEAVA
jgi:hypothetical protein